MKPNRDLSLEEFKQILIRQTELYEQEVNNADEIRSYMVISNIFLRIQNFPIEKRKENILYDSKQS